MRYLGPAILAAAALGAGCTMVPKYERPAAPVTPTWKGTAAAGNTATNATSDIEWKSFFGDPRLRALIALALENNRDLRVAALRVEQTQAQYRIRRSALYPGAQGDAGLVRQRSSGAISDFNGGSIVSVYSVNVSAAWEADVFGRIRSLKQEALEQYLATDEARKSVRMSLVAQVATEYLTQLRLLEAKAIAGRTLETVQASRDLIRQSFEAGVASELELRTADGQVEAVRVNSAAFLQLLGESENALVVLIGRPLPADLPQGQPFRGQELLADLPAGVPSEVLLRRPDVFKAAVAGAPVVDWRNYDTAYTERYLGVPPPAGANPEFTSSYERNGLLPYAKDLARPLLIAHGTADDNVHFSETLLLTNALFRAGKRFELIPHAGQTHQLGAEPELAARHWERVFAFFRENL